MLTSPPRTRPLVLALLLCGCTGSKVTTDREETGDDDDDTTLVAPTCGPCCHTPLLPECDSGETGDTGT